MKVSSINLNNAYNANMAKISFGNTQQANETIKPIYNQDITQFKSVKAKEVKPKSFFAKLVDKVKSLFTAKPDADAKYNPFSYSGNTQDYFESRIYV